MEMDLHERLKAAKIVNAGGGGAATDYKSILTDLIERDITSIVIPDTVTIIGTRAFNGCASLTNITIPDSVTEITSNAFNGCTGLTSITIPSSVTKILPTAFFSCPNLTAITVNKAEDSIAGAPWGAANATVVWTG